MRAARDLLAAVVAPPGLRLRPARPADRDHRLAVYAASRDDERRAAGWPDALWLAFVADQFALRERHHGDAVATAVVERRGGGGGARRAEAIGVLTLAVEAEAGAEGTVARIVDVALLPWARGGGVGSALIEAVAVAATRLGHRALALDVHVGNSAAARLYARLGFRPRGGRGPATHHRLERRLGTVASAVAAV